MTVSVRLDASTLLRLRSLARSIGATQSEVLRRALRLLDESSGREGGGGERPLDLLAGWIGIVRGGARHLSTRTGRRFTTLLENRRR